jgi:hypothetical protein
MHRGTQVVKRISTTSAAYRQPSAAGEAPWYTFGINGDDVLVA